MVSRDRRVGRWWQRRGGGRRRAKEWPPTGEKADSSKGCVDGCAGVLGFREG